MTRSRPSDPLPSNPGPGEPPLLVCESIDKRFGDLVALRGVDLDVRAGEVHALLGENGAGKTTLMNLLYGLLLPDAGRIRWRGREARFGGPADALALGIGMVHQHFTLVPALTVWENVWLAHPGRAELLVDADRARGEVRALAERFGLALDPDARVRDLPVGARQRIEITKALTRDISLFILDEPTAVLAPGEVRTLFRVLRRLAEAGSAILFISHKLDEVLEVSDRITVLRHGRVTARCSTAEADAAELTRRILGDEIAAAPSARVRMSSPAGASEGEDRPALSVRRLETAAGTGVPLREISFDLRPGEILGVTGVDGNGQDELVAALAGLLRPRAGSIRLLGEDVTSLDVRARWRRGLSVLPGDRAREGLVPALTLWENLALREFGAPWARWRGRYAVVPNRHRRRAQALLTRHDVRSPGPGTTAARLSGGNQQKLLLARELAAEPEVLVLLNPTRGLDVGAADALYRTLDELRRGGRAVFLVSTELDEVLARADRWAVLSAGTLRESPTPDREAIGAMMLGGGRS